jgi:hypothetical protein
MLRPKMLTLLFQVSQVTAKSSHEPQKMEMLSATIFRGHPASGKHMHTLTLSSVCVQTHTHTHTCMYLSIYVSMYTCIFAEVSSVPQQITSTPKLMCQHFLEKQQLLTFYGKIHSKCAYTECKQSFRGACLL